jgi:hypothetical protein
MSIDGDDRKPSSNNSSMDGIMVLLSDSIDEGDDGASHSNRTSLENRGSNRKPGFSVWLASAASSLANIHVPPTTSPIRP